MGPQDSIIISRQKTSCFDDLQISKAENERMINYHEARYGEVVNDTPHSTSNLPNHYKTGLHNSVDML